MKKNPDILIHFILTKSGMNDNEKGKYYKKYALHVYISVYKLIISSLRFLFGTWWLLSRSRQYFTSPSFISSIITFSTGFPRARINKYIKIIRDFEFVPEFFTFYRCNYTSSQTFLCGPQHNTLSSYSMINSKYLCN